MGVIFLSLPWFLKQSPCILTLHRLSSQNADKSRLAFQSPPPGIRLLLSRKPVGASLYYPPNVLMNLLAAVKHPLPPKPVAPGGPAPHKYEPNRPVIGVKRSASIATHEQPQSHPARRRSFKWPVLECIHSVRVKGDENVGIRGITFNSNGSHFAVNCE